MTRRPSRSRIWQLLLAFCVLPSSLVAQGIRFTRFGEEHGLRQPVIHDLLQGSEGFLWLGTADGLVRYDGYEFERIDIGAPNGPSTTIHVLHQSPDGTLWVGTHDHGLVRFDVGTGDASVLRHNPDDPGSLPSDSITALHEEPDGTLWVGTESGLARLDAAPESFESFRYDAENATSLSHDNVSSITTGADGTIWVGTTRGLNAFDPVRREFRRYLHDPDDPGSLSEDHVNAVFEDRHGALWVGTYSVGLNRREAGSETFERFFPDAEDPGSYASTSAKTIFEDSAGQLWVGTWSRGLERFDRESGSFVHHKTVPGDPESLSDNRVYAIVEDAVGQLWIGTHLGLSVYDPHQNVFTNYRYRADDPNSLPTNYVRSVLEDRNGDLWVGTYQGGVARIDGDTGVLTSYRHDPQDPHSLANDGVWSMLEDSSGRLWLGTSRGLHRYDPVNDHFHRYQKDPIDAAPFSGSNILSLQEGTDGSLWLGTWNGGVNRFDPATGDVEHFLPDPDDPFSLSASGIYSILRTTSGELWVGSSEAGLNRLDATLGRFERFRPDPSKPGSLSSDAVWDLFEDSGGRLWVGTDAGLDLWQPESRTFRSVLSSDESGLTPAYAIEEDLDGSLWVVSSSAIARLEPDTGAARWYDRDDGLRGPRYSAGVSTRGREGRIYVGGANGLDVFDPSRVQDHTFVPPVVLTDFLLLNRSVTPGPDAPLRADVSVAEEVTLTHADYPFTFEFSALNFRQPHKNRFAFMMEGIDQDWVETDAAHRRASYTTVPPGTHTFRVKAASDDGRWNEEGASIRVIVLPAWWETPGFRAAATFGILLTLFGIYRWRVFTVERQNEKLEALVRERTRELEASNRKLEEASLTDPLTGLKNRRFLQEHIGHHVSRSLRIHRSATVSGREPANGDVVALLIDLDHFKRINDEHGHDAGDRVLVEMRDLLVSVCRESDVLVRWGGEEFLVVCLSASRDDAFATAERIRRAVQDHPFGTPGGESLRVTCSIGCASFPFLPSEPEAFTWEQVIAMADRGLYLGKSSGRNQSVYVEAAEANDGSELGDVARRDLHELIATGKVRVLTSTPVRS